MDDKPPDAAREKEEEAGAEVSLRYGCFGFRPAFLQWLNRPAWWVVFMSLAGMSQAVAVGALLGVNMSTIEKRFGFSSGQSGIIASSYELAGLPVMLVVGYVGGKGSRPRWVGLGLLLLSLGSFLFALPHFLTGPYDYDSTVLRDENLCYGNSTGNGTSPDECGEKSQSLSSYLGVFIASYCVMGVGTIPLYSIGLTYIDDITKRNRAAFYIGIFFVATTLGPAAAFVGAGFLLNIYTDADRGITPDIGRYDPRWVGAWWIGFLITGVMALMAAIPILGFPTDMPGAAAIRAQEKTEAHRGEQEVDPAESGVSKAKDFVRSVKVLMTNGTFVCLSIAGITDAMMVTGFTNYGPKFMAQQFSLSEGYAAAIFGLMVIPGAAGGTLLASYLMKRLMMTCRQMLLWCFICSFLSLFSSFVIFAVCDSAEFAGVNRDYHTGPDGYDDFDLMDGCNSGCGCSRLRFGSVCGSDNLLYFSPCYAGCKDMELQGLLKVYHNCSCVAAAGLGSSWATPQPCDAGCHYLWVFVPVFLAAMFLTFCTAMFNINATMRCVPAREKSFGVSIGYFVSKALGNLPAPIIFGSALDISCVLWDQTCDGRGACRFYENSTMAWAMFILVIIFKSVSSLAFFISWWIYKQPPPESDPGQDMDKLPEKTVTSQNGHVNTVTSQNGQVNTMTSQDDHMNTESPQGGHVNAAMSYDEDTLDAIIAKFMCKPDILESTQL